MNVVAGRESLSVAVLKMRLERESKHRAGQIGQQQASQAEAVVVVGTIYA